MVDLSVMSKVREIEARSTVALPDGLLEAVQPLLAQSGSTLDEFVAEAVTEKLEALRQMAYFEGRRARAVPGLARELLAKAGRDGPVQPGDELP
jgi:hypothetical protein